MTRRGMEMICNNIYALVRSSPWFHPGWVMAIMDVNCTVSARSEDERHALQLFQVLYRMNPQATKSRLLEVLQAELLKQSATRTVSRASVIPLGREKR
jgi:hypothetical protein